MGISQSEEPVHDLRKLEAIAAGKYLRKFNSVETLFFEEKVFDGRIHTDFNKKKFDKLESMVLSLGPDEMVTLCHEGGHQDHDSVELITRLFSINHNISMQSCSGYRGSKISPKFFSTMKPTLPDKKISFPRFLTLIVAVRLMMIYKSQAKTWLGLAPMLLINYGFSTFRTARTSQKADVAIIRNCFYENRGRALQSEVLQALQKLAVNFSSNK
jgi:hypothetical protein